MVGFPVLRSNWRLGVLVLVLASLVGACRGSDSPGSTSNDVATSVTVAPTAQSQSSSSTGGGAVGLDEALDQVIMLYEELLAVLADVTDEASARAASAEVARITAEFEEIEKRMDEFSEQEITSAALATRFFGFGQELADEMMRIWANPEALALLEAAIGNLGDSETPSATPNTQSRTSPGTVAPVQGPTGETTVPTSQPTEVESAGAAACLLFGELFANYVRATDPTFILEIADSLRSLQASGEAAEEEEIRDAVEGMAGSVDNSAGVPDETLGAHMEAMSQACLANYSEEYLSGSQQ